MLKNVVKFLVPLAAVGFLLWWFLGPPLEVGYAPKQPVNYSHTLHAGKLDIDCQYCHTGVTKGKKAGVPSVNICMNCHGAVATAMNREGFKRTKEEIEASKVEIKKIVQASTTKTPLEWIRVHNMPDHVRFSHAPHLNFLLKEGQPTKQACVTCHGEVDKMDVVRWEKNLNMGTCVNCHRQNQAKGGRTDCAACHY